MDANIVIICQTPFLLLYVFHVLLFFKYIKSAQHFDECFSFLREWSRHTSTELYLRIKRARTSHFHDYFFNRITILWNSLPDDITILFVSIVYLLGVLQKHKWENCMTVDRHSWGYRRNTTLADFLTMDDLTSILASTVR